MTKLKITNDTRHSDLVDFCGDKLESFTGQTFVITKRFGRVLIEHGDEIVKNDDGTFEVNKADIF